MSDRDIRFLLNLYDTEYVKGEVRSRESLKTIRDESKRKHRYLLLDELITEANLPFTGDQKQMARYLIDTYSDDLKALHRRASTETILLAFIFYLKKVQKPSIRLGDYAITRKYELSDDVFEIILCRMLLEFLKKTPILPRQSTKDEHDTLYKTRGRT